MGLKIRKGKLFNMKHILLLGTGGTIACKHGDNGLTPLLTGEELLSYVPAARKFCQVESVQILNIDSTNVHPKHWLIISKAIRWFRCCSRYRYNGLHSCGFILPDPAL